MIIPWYLDKKKAEAAATSKTLDHLGLVMGICKELQLIDHALVGAIPESISQLDQLVSLNLRNNHHLFEPLEHLRKHQDIQPQQV